MNVIESNLVEFILDPSANASRVTYEHAQYVIQLCLFILDRSALERFFSQKGAYLRDVCLAEMSFLAERFFFLTERSALERCPS